jgi:hypothetical protein
MRRTVDGLRVWLGILVVCVSVLTVASGNEVRAQEGNGTGVPPGEEVNDFNAGLPLELEVGSDSEFSNSGDACVGPAVPVYTKQEPIDRYEKVKKVAKDGTVTYVDGKYLRTERFVTISCNGSLLRQFWQCTSCPSATIPNFKRVVRAQLRRQVAELQQPNPSLWPKLSNQAPLPGIPFFYGINGSQFRDPQPDWLTVCVRYDCASVFVSAKPKRVYFTPGDGTPLKTSCDWAGPVVESKKAAYPADPLVAASYKKCRHVFKKAGKFRANLEILYEISWKFHDWTFPGAPPVETGLIYGTTGQPFTLTVHERQPVVIG